MGSGNRSDRVSIEIHRILSQLMLKGLRDPRVKSFSITNIRVTPDLRLARIRCVPMGGGDGTKLLAGLRSASGYLSRELAKQLRMKYSPKLEFFLDEELSKAMNVIKGLDYLDPEE